MKKIAKTLLLSGLCLFLSSCVITTPRNWGEYHYNNAENYSVGDATIDGEVNCINIDWIKGNVNFVTTAENNVSISESCSESLSHNDKVHYWYDARNKELNIKFFSTKNKIYFDEISKDLTINIPSSYASLSIIADTVSADINSSVSIVNSYEMDSNSGNLRVTNANNINRISFDSVSGDVNIDCNTITTFISDTTSGDITITTNDANRIECDSTSGDFTINIPETLGFYVEYDTVSGDFNTNVHVREDGDKYYYGNEKVRIIIDSVSGDINVNVR